MVDLKKSIDEAVGVIRSKTDFEPEVGLILGSGLGDYADQIQDPVVIPYCEIPGFPVSTVSGHAGQFVIGIHQGKRVIAMQGRVHSYEGYPQSQITLPVRIMKRLGVSKLLVTNAAGGVNLDFKPGTLMVLTDHINYSGGNPLVGENLDEFGPRFPDMSDVYTSRLRAKLKEEAERTGIVLAEGIYLMYSGPNYETPAEIRAFRSMGADAVGMSTVPEALVASHCQMEVIGISCITNMAAGVLDRKLDHSEVVETASRVKVEFVKLLDLILAAVL